MPGEAHRCKDPAPLTATEPYPKSPMKSIQAFFLSAGLLTAGVTVAQADIVPHVEDFQSVCGVALGGGEYYNYRCEVVDEYNDATRAITTLKYPDQEIRLIWMPGHQVAVQFEGASTLAHTSYTTAEGQTSFSVDGKTYYYYSDQQAAAFEIRNFSDGGTTAEEPAEEKRGNMIVYADPNFGGTRTLIRESNPNIISTGLNDTIESMQITNGRWKFCTEINYQGSCIMLPPGNYPDLSVYNLSNNISSVEIQ
jgi:hypothetical protein